MTGKEINQLYRLEVRKIVKYEFCVWTRACSGIPSAAICHLGESADTASQSLIDLFVAYSAAYGLEHIQQCILAVSLWQLTMFLFIDSTYKVLGTRYQDNRRLREETVNPANDQALSVQRRSCFWAGLTR
jgi:hypothetical protein